MQKRIIFLMFFLLIVSPFIISQVATVSAADIGSTSTNPLSNFGNLSARWELWKIGSDNLSQEQLGLLGETTKYLVLILIIIAVFAALGAMEFPSQTLPRILLSIVIGLLGTFMITTKEILTAMISYSALTLTILLALPLIILLGFTVLSAYKANSAGLYASKILWAAFAIFIIFKALVLLMMFNYFVVVDNPTVDDGKTIHDYTAELRAGVSVVPPLASAFLPLEKTGGSTQTDDKKIGQIMGNADHATAWVLLLSGLAIMWFMVISSKWIYGWLEKEARDAKIDAAKNNIQLSTARDKLQAEAMKDVAET